ILYPVILICLYQALRFKKTILWVLLTVFCGIQVLLAPEFGLLALCFGSVIILRDLLEGDREQSWARRFHPTIVCGAVTVLFMAFAVWLLSTWGALGGFFMMAVQLARGHLQTGSIPVQSMESLLWLTGIPLLFIVGSTFVFAHTLLRSRRQVS